MSHAWKKLRTAVNKLTQEGPQRTRLAAAMTDIATLRPKDLPGEVQHELSDAMDRVCLGRVQEQGATITIMIDAMHERDVQLVIEAILNMYDAVTRYQPIYPALEPAKKSELDRFRF